MKPMTDRRFGQLCTVKTADNKPINFGQLYWTIESDGVKPVCFERYACRIRQEYVKVGFKNNARNYWYKDLYTSLWAAQENLMRV